MAKLDMTGLKFGRLTVLGFSHRIQRNKGTILYWHCICDCGTIKIIRAQSLKRGSIKSCGCLRRETTTKLKTKHGMTGTSIYYIWAHMIERCENSNVERYKSYGGRGITVCERWHTFKNFLADMGPTWFSGASIERQNVNGNYEPSNCIWIRRSDQSKNRQKSIIIDSPWGKLNAKFVAKYLGLSPGTFYWRIKNWPRERWLEPKHQNSSESPR